MGSKPFGPKIKSDPSTYDPNRWKGTGRFIRIEMDSEKIHLIPSESNDTALIINDTHRLGLHYVVKSRKVFSINGIWSWAWWRLRHIRRITGDDNIPFDWVFTRKLWTRVIFEPPISIFRADNIEIFDVLLASCREAESNAIDFEQFAGKVLVAYHAVLSPKEANAWARTYYQ